MRKQKSPADGKQSHPQGIGYAVGGTDAAFVKVSKGVFMRCDAMRKIRAIATESLV